MLTKEDVKRIVLENCDGFTDPSQATWVECEGGSEFLVDEDGMDIGITVDETEIRLHEAEPGYKKILYSEGEEAIREAIIHFAEDGENSYDPDNLELSIMIDGKDQKALEEIANYVVKVCKEKGLNLFNCRLAGGENDINKSYI